MDVFDSVRQPPVFSIHSEWTDKAAFELHARLRSRVRELRWLSCEAIAERRLRGRSPLCRTPRPGAVGRHGAPAAERGDFTIFGFFAWFRLGIRWSNVPAVRSRPAC